LVKHFVDMFISDNEETRNLAEKLVQYSYATGGIQQALQFVKYIPVAYLKTTNFGSRLVELSDSLKGDSFKLDIFIEQYFQHNPGKARKYNIPFPKEADQKVINAKIKEVSTNGITFDVEVDDMSTLKYKQ